MMYAIKMKDGSVRIMNLTDEALSVEHEIAKWGDKDNVVSFREIQEEHLPSDRTFRNAWTDDFPTETVDVDMDKAKDIHMDRIRKLRNQKLKELDIETMKGIDVQEQKQILRDIPQTLNLEVKTPEELKDIMPKELTTNGK